MDNVKTADDLINAGWKTNGTYWWIDGCEGMSLRDAIKHQNECSSSSRSQACSTVDIDFEALVSRMRRAIRNGTGCRITADEMQLLTVYNMPNLGEDDCVRL